MIGWALSGAVAVSLLILAIVALRGPVARAFGARAAYALWAAPLIRAVMPPLPALSLPAPAGPVSLAPVRMMLIQSPASSGWTLGDAIVAAWLGGAALFLAYHIIRHHRFIASALGQGHALAIAGIPYDIVASAAVEGPVATGLVHPLILVPLDFSKRFDAEQQRLALLHEQLHHRHGDLWASAAALIVTGLLWFNPVAHLALRAFRRDMEAACDARVIASSGAEAAPLYAETILRCAARPIPRSLCALTTIDELKGRLTMLKSNPNALRRSAGLVLAASLTVGGLALSGPAFAGDPDKTEIVTKKIIIHDDSDKKSMIGDRHDVETLNAKCAGEWVDVSGDNGSADKKQMFKLRICPKPGETPAQLAEQLAKAKSELDQDSDMDPKLKADVKAKLDARIAELRSKG